MNPRSLLESNLVLPAGEEERGGERLGDHHNRSNGATEANPARALDDTHPAADPRFVDHEPGDLHLQARFSPAEDAGNPFAGYHDLHGSGPDWGAHGAPAGTR